MNIVIEHPVASIIYVLLIPLFYHLILLLSRVELLRTNPGEYLKLHNSFVLKSLVLLVSVFWLVMLPTILFINLFADLFNKND